MRNNVVSAFSLFTLIPMFLFAMIFPVARLSFITIEHVAGTPASFSNHSFSDAPSNDSHPVGEYIEGAYQSDRLPLDTLPAISHSSEELPDDAKKILTANLSQNGNLIINDTTHSVDTENVVSAFAPLEAAVDGPVVLVLHTHATESFLADSESYKILNDDGSQSLYYSPETASTRSTDCSENVVHLGEIFADTLIKNGIDTIHCKTLHDYPDYNKSYSNSYKSVKEYLLKYPSIKYVIDLHRDSIVKENGDKLKPLCRIDNKDTAQIMLVMGSGTKHPDWQKNLSLALKFKTECDSKYPEFSRPVYLRTASFNQELSPGMLLLEVGSCANTLEEAENAAYHAAEIFAEIIK